MSVYTTHSDWFEVLEDKPSPPVIGWSSTLEGARAITAAYLLEMRRNGYKVRLYEKDSEGTVYCVSKGNHCIRVWLDCPPYEVEYQNLRRKELKQDAATKAYEAASEAEKQALKELDDAVERLGL